MIGLLGWAVPACRSARQPQARAESARNSPEAKRRTLRDGSSFITPDSTGPRARWLRRLRDGDPRDEPVADPARDRLQRGAGRRGRIVRGVHGEPLAHLAEGRAGGDGVERVELPARGAGRCRLCWAARHTTQPVGAILSAGAGWPSERARQVPTALVARRSQRTAGPSVKRRRAQSSGGSRPAPRPRLPRRRRRRRRRCARVRAARDWAGRGGRGPRRGWQERPAARPPRGAGMDRATGAPADSRRSGRGRRRGRGPPPPWAPRSRVPRAGGRSTCSRRPRAAPARSPRRPPRSSRRRGWPRIVRRDVGEAGLDALGRRDEAPEAALERAQRIWPRRLTRHGAPPARPPDRQHDVEGGDLRVPLDQRRPRAEARRWLPRRAARPRGARAARAVSMRVRALLGVAGQVDLPDAFGGHRRRGRRARRSRGCAR